MMVIFIANGDVKNEISSIAIECYICAFNFTIAHLKYIIHDHWRT
jgi:hypothetical protein